jgi:hypothetical protein
MVGHSASLTAADLSCGLVLEQENLGAFVRHTQGEALQCGVEKHHILTARRAGQGCEDGVAKLHRTHADTPRELIADFKLWLDWDISWPLVSYHQAGRFKTISQL